MTIEESKIFLKQKGYTSFNLKDFNFDYYNLLLPFKCNETHNLKEHIKGLRADCPGLNIQKSYNSFQEAEFEKNSIGLIDTSAFAQMYYQQHIAPVFENVMRKSNNSNVFYEKIVPDIIRYYFDIDKSIELISASTYLTYYDKGCLLNNHSDGTGTGRICALLIYLNEDYNKDDGGILILENEYDVLPIFGNVAIIDLQSYDILHAVSKVTGGIGRYAILSFVKTKENEFFDSDTDRKKSLI